ncbi:histone-arginine methyltransferase METTL23-like [Uranotaenia lowii]|uniref:histone-arginine methyltransferase METTL23-like n=1 Tax=Uranotaenia lowii TaxID=190385 RepID=UPI0024786F41|nr:histone-arginine methyltransferase METTL23-like [Uranotaenia lowii]XP_055608699.1 histone-arginine methyltransferase METTL23-like [Uranotaenia lowii]
MTRFHQQQQQMENNVEQIKTFIFGTKNKHNAAEATEKLEVLIPELLLPGYSFYTWPSAHVLAWFLWQRRVSLSSKRVLELGAGTSLPGIVAAKCGAHVTLTDCSTLPKTLQHIQRCCRLNHLIPGKDIEVVGLTWGLFLDQIFQLGAIDLIIGSDIFYDPSVFEDILVTVSFLLEANPQAKFLFTYQERSSDWSIETLLKKWGLNCNVISLDNLSTELAIDPQELMGNHTIHLLEVTKRS